MRHHKKCGESCEKCRGTRTEEFDYDLTPSQWETLKALRTPASKLPRMNRYMIDSLIALELATMNGDAPAITAK